MAKKPPINAFSLRAVSLSAALALACQSSAVYAQSAIGSNLGLSMSDPAASDFGAVKPPEVPLRELPLSHESGVMPGMAGLAPLNSSVSPQQMSDNVDKKDVPSGKATTKSGVKAGAKSSDKTANKTADKPLDKTANKTDKPSDTGTDKSASKPDKIVAGTAASAAGSTKSVSMASPFAPPMQPMLDTSTPAKSNAKSSTPPGAASSSNASAASNAARQGLSPTTPTVSPSLPGWPNALPSSPGAAGAFATNNGIPASNAEDNYPVIGTLETSIFGTATPATAIEERLAKLENAVYKKSFSSESLFERTERLKATLLGLQSQEPDPNAPGGSSRFIESASGSGSTYFDAIAALPENQSAVEPEELQRYFFMLVNEERQKFGYGPLEPDQVATKLAADHAAELGRRRALSHQDLKGNNPDRRYTLAGGNDLLYESIVSINNDTGVQKPTRAIAVNLLKTIMNRQDEREALMASDATGLGFAIEWSKGKEKIFACSDVLTRHGVIQPIPYSVQVGEKIDVKGVVMPPFHFDKITVAWEGPNPGMASIADDSEEALPYFAPLDYAAFAHHSDNDHQGTITALKTAGIIAAIAGGVFIPPVALAAPLIAMSGSNSEPKPASDIPIKGGVHVDGNAFEGRIAINHEGKEGIYYITVWASLTKYGKPIAISRRAIVATAAGGGSNVAQGGPARSLSNGNEVDTEKVSAQVVGDNGAPTAPSKPAKTKHKHNKQSPPPQDPNP